MEFEEDAIVDISPAREIFFGCLGERLIPSRATVEALIQQIPETRIISLELLRQKLADQFNVEVTCPSTPTQILKAISRDSEVAYWPVAKKNGD